MMDRGFLLFFVACVFAVISIIIILNTGGPGMVNNTVINISTSSTEFLSREDLVGECGCVDEYLLEITLMDTGFKVFYNIFENTSLVNPVMFCDAGGFNCRPNPRLYRINETFYCVPKECKVGGGG